MKHPEERAMRTYLETQLSRDHGYNLLTLVKLPLDRLLLMHFESHGR